MGLIINLRGIGGSGKTELARRIMREYGWTGKGSEIASPGITRVFVGKGQHPLGYRLAHPVGGRPLIVFGDYERKSGGCDTIRLKDGGLAEVFRSAAEYVESGHDVLIEGLRLSHETDGSLRLARLYPYHIIHVDTPPAASARNLVRRRRAGTDQVPLLTSKGMAERDGVAASCERLRAHAEVHTLGFDDALARTRDLLRLAPAGRAAPGTVAHALHAAGSI